MKRRNFNLLAGAGLAVASAPEFALAQSLENAAAVKIQLSPQALAVI